MNPNAVRLGDNFIPVLIDTVSGQPCPAGTLFLSATGAGGWPRSVMHQEVSPHGHLHAREYHRWPDGRWQAVTGVRCHAIDASEVPEPVRQMMVA